MAKARQQYFADEVTLQKENRDFAIQPELVEKLESIEAWAQVNVIETVKVNWEALTPDENKAVDVSVPLVEDTLYSTDPDKALSANQWKVLYEYIQNLASRGRYLSNWNTVTWLPSTNPVDNPYQYRAWDYYVVSNVAALWWTNYRPNGSSYSWGVASTTVESEVVKVWDYYTYDWQYWLLLVNTAREIAVDSSLSTTSTNPVENRVVTNALNTKQNNIADLETIRSWAALWATALQPWDSLSELTWTSDDITQWTTNLFMTTAERSKLSNQSWVNTWDETQTTIKNKLWQASASTDGYLTSTDWNTFNNKQWAISDLETIRSNASAWKNASDTIATYWDIVTHDASEFATAAQWAKADTALQSGDNVSELVNDAWYITDAYHDDTKQDKLIAWANIQIAADWKTISATDTTYVAWDFDIKDLADSTWLRAEWSWKQDELIAWTNIQIAADWKTISATDTTYTAWPGISISNNNVISNTQTSAEWWNITWTLSDQTDLQDALDEKQDKLTAGDNVSISEVCVDISDMQWPAPEGFHVPLNSEWWGVKNIMDGLSLTTWNLWKENLHIPFAGLRVSSNAGIINQNSLGYYWSSSASGTDAAYIIWPSSSSVWMNITYERASGFSIRCFKNTFEAPTSSWTVIQWTLWSAWIFWNQTDWLISITSDWSIGYTIMDKNLWATTVYNSWDTLNEANCGKYYQWWNNYGFAWTGNITTSSTQVDASNYWPGNYYSDSTFITWNRNWSSVQNDNLRWWVTQQSTQSCSTVISATDTTYTAGTWIDITNWVISNTQTSAEWWNITWTLTDQTDLVTALNAKQDDMVILSYGNSTWNDFITAYNKNWVVYCRASSNSNPASGSQTRLAFMAYVNNETTPTEVEFQYYRSRNDHNSAANQLDEVYVYKLTSNWTWTVTQRNTAAKATAWTWINLTYGSGNMTIANTWVTSINSQTWDVTLTIPTVPTNVSDFVNDAWYITANDLPTVDTTMSDSSTNAVQNNVIKNYVDTQVQEATSGAVSDTAYWSSWDWITGIAPSKNAVYDKISAMDTTIAWKQNTISDLSTIRSWAALWATAVQPWGNVSTLTNDAGFITKAVSDLTNYYTKSETYTKSEVADYVANFAWFKVVATLPTTDIKTTIIYLLWPVGTWADKYEEYIYSNNAWVKIWETSVDLTNYFNTSTQTSDAITQGSTNLFLTSAERTKLSNTSGTNTGDETKATIQSKLGAATSSNDWYLSSADWATFNNKQNALSTSNAWENIGISNWVISANNAYTITDADVTITTTDEYWVSPYNTSYYYTNIEISESAWITWREWAIYILDCWSAWATSTYRNCRIRIGSNWDWKPIMNSNNTILGGHSYLTTTQTRMFIYKTTMQSNWALHMNADSTYSNMTASEANTWTATSARSISATVLKWAIQTHAVNDTAYASSWNWVTTQAPSKNAVYDKISAMDTTISWKQATLVSGTNIKTINNTSLLWSGNISITAWDMSYTDFNWVAKTWATITLDLASTYTPSANFTVNAPSTIKDGQTYILRVENWSTAYTMTLWTNVTNPYGTDITLTADWIDQFVFLAIWGNLELQPEWWGGGWWGWAITADTTWTTTSISKIWVGTEAEYAALTTYEENVAYMTY